MKTVHDNHPMKIENPGGLLLLVPFPIDALIGLESPPGETRPSKAVDPDEHRGQGQT